MGCCPGQGLAWSDLRATAAAVLPFSLLLDLAAKAAL